MDTPKQPPDPIPPAPLTYGPGAGYPSAVRSTCTALLST
jgi:hypothetical protein